MFKLASLFVEIGADHRPLDAALASVRAGLATFARMPVRLGGLVSTFGLAGAVSALAAAAKTAVDMEAKMAALSKATDLEGEALARMKAGLTDLSTRVKGISLDALIEIATSGAKLGIATDQLLEYAEGVAKVATAIDDIPAAELADSIGKINSVLKLGVRGTLQLGSAIDKIADSGTSSAKDILSVTQRISGTGAVAGISAQELIALSGALLDTGTHSMQAAGSLGRLIQSLNDVDGRKGFAKALGVDDVTLKQMIETKPMAVLQDFLGKVRSMNAMGQGQAIASIGLKGSEDISEIEKLVSKVDELARYTALANNEFKTLDQINKSYAATANLTASNLTTFKNRVQILGDTLGTALLPPLNAVLSLGNDLAVGLGDAFASIRQSADSWGINLSGVVEGLGAGFRNLGAVFERTGVMIGGTLLNAWEYLSYGGEVGAAVGVYLWESMVEAFGIILRAAGNLKDGLVDLFQEVWDYIASAGKDPIELHFKPILDGVKVGAGDGKFVMPELRLSSVDNQLDAIDQKIREREQARADKGKGLPGAGRVNPGGGNPRPQPNGGAGGELGDSKHSYGITDVDSYAKELQEGALKGGDVQAQIRDAARQTADGVMRLINATEAAARRRDRAEPIIR